MSNLFMSNRAKDAFDNDIPLTEFMNFERYIRFYMLRVINYCVSKSFYPDIHYSEFNEIDEEFIEPPTTSGIEEANKKITQILKSMHELRLSLAATNSNKLLLILNEFFQDLYKRNYLPGIKTEFFAKKVLKSGNFFSGINVSEETRFEQGKQILKNLNTILMFNEYSTLKMQEFFEYLKEEGIIQFENRIEEILSW